MASNSRSPIKPHFSPTHHRGSFDFPLQIPPIPRESHPETVQIDVFSDLKNSEKWQFPVKTPKRPSKPRNFRTSSHIPISRKDIRSVLSPKSRSPKGNPVIISPKQLFFPPASLPQSPHSPSTDVSDPFATLGRLPHPPELTIDSLLPKLHRAVRALVAKKHSFSGVVTDRTRCINLAVQPSISPPRPAMVVMLDSSLDCEFTGKRTGKGTFMTGNDEKWSEKQKINREKGGNTVFFPRNVFGGSSLLRSHKRPI